MNREKQLSPGLSWAAADRWFVADHGRGRPGRLAAVEFVATGASAGGSRLIAVSSGDIE
ncbi:hypothetical protein KDX32_18490 [Burkholderia ambifaria]|jgi:hypothetical protein|uniref:hypothetical protein n=1 Tax=Burkholderia TaxID=32008 RepID=UPI001643A815|nr:MULTISPECIES: hypothetical protein [Burkholderia]MBR8065073.1 hypothetical protein [Burkholderia ambifaria]